ncbi:unnamed protein product [Macrosiphum euphorbiae]|uniref:Uncharacterized protein n=1 Tax=Macrosiphum euphorbiae TaxID=13131 RepID=A0AAV0VXB0_9HEMI|nr:unnamed protein product [Macrosiphum euphorbiae]
MDKLRRVVNNKRKLIEKKHKSNTFEVPSTYNTNEITTQIEPLENAFNTYVKTHDELAQELEEDSEVDSLIDQFENVSSTYMRVKANLKNMISERNPTEVRDMKKYIKLPPINLPQFSGKLEEWYTFKDQFEAMVHNNQNIDNTQRMHHLRSSLTGQAASVISSMSSDAHSYIEAWNLIKGRFDNKHLVFQTHLHCLFTQPVVQAEAPNMLKTLIDTTNNHIRALKTLGRPVDHWDDVIVHTVATKLPPDIRKTWEIESAGQADFPTWKTLSAFVEGRIHALEVMQFRQGSSGKIKQLYNKTAYPYSRGTERSKNQMSDLFTTS